MFSGIVTDIGTLERVEPAGGGRRVRIGCGFDTGSVDIGASIACAGVCLTVVARQPGWFEADISAETMAKTTLGVAQEGARLNLERALRLGDELGGHMVLGHVDGIASIAAVDKSAEAWCLRFSAPDPLAPFIAEKGSVTLDGTSLTVNNVADRMFDVTLVPHTLAVTTWGQRAAGDTVNLEIDVLARYVARLAQSQGEEPI